VGFAGAMAVALALDALLGWPGGVFVRIGHPVIWLGTLIEALDRRADLCGLASLVTVRAVRVDSSLLRTSCHLLSRDGGRLFLLGGSDAVQDGMSMFGSVESVDLPVGGRSRLVIATV